MPELSPKLISVVKKSVQAQMEFSVEGKATRLIEMLEIIAKRTKYESEVYRALDDYHKAVDKENGNV